MNGQQATNRWKVEGGQSSPVCSTLILHSTTIEIRFIIIYLYFILLLLLFRFILDVATGAWWETLKNESSRSLVIYLGSSCQWWHCHRNQGHTSHSWRQRCFPSSAGSGPFHCGTRWISSWGLSCRYSHTSGRSYQSPLGYHSNLVHIWMGW